MSQTAALSQSPRRLATPANVLVARDRTHQGFSFSMIMWMTA